MEDEKEIRRKLECAMCGENLMQSENLQGPIKNGKGLEAKVRYKEDREGRKQGGDFSDRNRSIPNYKR